MLVTLALSWLGAWGTQAVMAVLAPASGWGCGQSYGHSSSLYVPLPAEYIPYLPCEPSSPHLELQQLLPWFVLEPKVKVFSPCWGQRVYLILDLSKCSVV